MRERRILHVFDGTLRGGLESAVMQLFRRIDRSRYRFDFVVRSTSPGEYEREIESLGGRLFRCPNHRNPLAFDRALRAVLRTGGPYDVIHSHVEHYSGIVLAIAAAAGVPIRIAHSHNDRSAEPASLARRGYRRLMGAAVARFATLGLAPSAAAARFMFGADWRRDGRWRVLPYGIDLAPFRPDPDRAPDRDALRAALGIPPDALVVGHVGRFDPQKNHGLWLRIMGALRAREPRARGLLIGGGARRCEVERTAAQAGLAGQVIFAGVRADVPALMLAAMDAFLFPSRHEGLGLALVEAQAAGLPCVISDVIPPEADALPDRVRRLALDAPLAAWVDALQDALRGGRASDAADRLARSAYAIDTSLAIYAAAYDGATPGDRLTDTASCAASPA
jgi:glycosyltransferase involved in cell wall biosynthesis